MTRLGVAAALAACAVWTPAAPAAADDAPGFTHAGSRFQLDLKPAWRAADGEDREGVLVQFRHADLGLKLAVARIDYPNRPAWRSKTREDYADAVEAGVRAAASGYKRVRRKVHKLGIVPAMDLEFSRTVGGKKQVVTSRYLFFRRYTLVLSVTAPPGSRRRTHRQARAARDTFTPWFGS